MRYNQLGQSQSSQKSSSFKQIPLINQKYSVNAKKIFHKQVDKYKTISNQDKIKKRNKDENSQKFQQKLFHKNQLNETNQHFKQLEAMLKTKLTVSQYPADSKIKNKNFVNKIVKTKKQNQKFYKNNNMKEQNGQSQTYFHLGNQIQQDSTKQIIQNKNNKNEKNQTRYKSNSLAKNEQYTFSKTWRTKSSAGFTGMNSYKSMQKRIKITLKNPQKYKNNHIQSENILLGKRTKSNEKLVSINNSIVNQKNYTNCFCSVRKFFQSFQQSKQFVKQYLSHRRALRKSAQIQNNSYHSQDEQNLFNSIKQYISSQAIKKRFNQQSINLVQQDDFRKRNQLKKKQNLKKCQEYQNHQCQSEKHQNEMIDGWKEGKIISQLENNFIKTTSVLRKPNIQEFQQHQIIQFMQRSKK